MRYGQCIFAPMFKVAWHESYAHHLPPGHRFPMEKYTLLPEQLLYEGTISQSDIFAPGLLEEEVLLRTHNADYWQKLRSLSLNRQEERKTGFPHSDALIEREIRIMQGTLDAARFAMQDGVSFNVAGGTHHAYTDHGEGFCLLNDIAIAANEMLHTGEIDQALVVDLDVHQGNGTAEIFEHEKRVFTFSMHGAANYPMHKEKSDLDVPLPDQTTDESYLETLAAHLPQLIEQTEPDIIFFQSGVDVLKSDKLGRLAMTIEGCKMRDRMVLETAKQHNIPVTASMGGGYSPEIKYIVEAHANTFRLAKELFT